MAFRLVRKLLIPEVILGSPETFYFGSKARGVSCTVSLTNKFEEMLPFDVRDEASGIRQRRRRGE